jgi:hypothetical protein
LKRQVVIGNCWLGTLRQLVTLIKETVMTLPTQNPPTFIKLIIDKETLPVPAILAFGKLYLYPFSSLTSEIDVV